MDAAAAAVVGKQQDDGASSVVAVAGQQQQQPVEAFSPDSQKMPDWKKELLLKRKSKVHTTNATASTGGDDPHIDAVGECKLLDTGADLPIRSSSAVSVTSVAAATSGTITSASDMPVRSSSSSSNSNSNSGNIHSIQQRQAQATNNHQHHLPSVADEAPSSSPSTASSSSPSSALRRPATIESHNNSSNSSSSTTTTTTNTTNTHNNIAPSTAAAATTAAAAAAATAQSSGVSNGTSESTSSVLVAQRTATDGGKHSHDDDDDDHAAATQPQQSHSRHGTDRKPSPTSNIAAPSERLTDAVSSNVVAVAAAVVVAGDITATGANPSKSNAAAVAINTYEKNSALANKPQTVANNKYVKLSERSKSAAHHPVVHSPAPVTSKMVAMPHDQQQLHAQQTGAEPFGFDDTSEELQYGPGIVSKLRCRYLSLALRQSNSKLRPTLDNMRRATSLNNLLNEDDDTAGDSRNGGRIDSPVAAHNAHHRPSWSNRPTSGDMSAHMTRSQNATPVSAISPSATGADARAGNAVPSGRQCRLPQRGNDSMKRARSVEALIRYDQSAWQRDQIIEQSSVTDKSPTSPPAAPLPPKHTTNVDTVSIEDKIANGRERGEHKPKRLTSFMDETERPPPDLVRQTLRLFEATANRNPKTSLRSTPNQSSDVAAKVNSFQTFIAQEKPALVFPKPPPSPKKAPLAAPRLTAPSLKPKPGVTAAVAVNGSVANSGKINGNGAAAAAAIIAANGSDARSRTPSPLTVRIDSAYRTNRLDSPLSPALRTYSPFLPSPLSPVHRGSNTTTAVVPQLPPSSSPTSDAQPDLLKSVAAAESPLIALTKKIETLRIDSPAILVASSDIVEDTAASPTSPVPSEQVDGKQRRISKSALANISKAGTTTEFKFGAKSPKSHLPGAVVQHSNTSTPKKVHHNEHSSAPVAATPPARQICIIRPQPKANNDSNAVAATPKLTSNGDHASNSTSTATPTIATVSATDATSATAPATASVALTSREIEKNHINREKHIIDDAPLSAPLSASPLTVTASKWVTPKGSPVPTALTTTTTTTAGGGGGAATFQKPWQQSADTHNNSMVFNFSNRKEVPDYIENDGLVVRRNKRELPKPGESGFVLLGDLTLETSTDPEDSWTMGPPSPCDVTFQNDNVVIDGKSCLRATAKSRRGARSSGQKRIHFNDTLTSTFEYPSESSLRLEFDNADGDDDGDDGGRLNDNINNAAGHDDDDDERDHDHDDGDNDDDYDGGDARGGAKDGRRHQLSMGSAPLGSYTPQKVAIMPNFELGVTRSPADNAATASTNGSTASADHERTSSGSSSSSSGSSALSNNLAESLQYLKPATDEQTVAWSEGTRVTDLLF